MKIGLIDADLIDNGTTMPNLALLKMSGYYKSQGNEVTLLTNYDNIDEYDKVCISKVFTKTFIPEGILEKENVEYGGTGFFYDKAPKLPYEIEHHMPDYELYMDWVNEQLSLGVKPKKLQYYTDYSIGFTTRGCFRQCGFCVNRNYKKVDIHACPSEFVDVNRKKICLFDDNILGSKDWESILDKLKSYNKPIVYKQGMDVRLLTKEKIKKLRELKYDGRYTFSFDNINDKEIISKKMALWNQETNYKRCMFYVFCGFENLDNGKDIEDLLERIYIIMKNQHLPYIMRHENYKNSKYEKLYINIARWCNQPSFYNKMSFRQFAELNQKDIKTEGKLSSCMQALVDFENDYPEIAKKYFDIKFTDFKVK